MQRFYGSIVIMTLTALSVWSRYSGAQSLPDEYRQVYIADTADTLKKEPYKPSLHPTYEKKDRYGDPFSVSGSRSPMWLKDPSNVNVETELDTSLNYINIYENIGDIPYRPPSRMTFEEYSKYQFYQSMRGYWKKKSTEGAEDEKEEGAGDFWEGRLIPKVYAGKFFGRIFGSEYIDIRPNGFVNLDFGARFERVNNPSLPVEAQRIGQFLFDERITLGLTGNIGDKGRLIVNWDTKSAFDFDNIFKFDYNAFDATPEDIIQSVEFGNVSMPINNSLIPGAQNLFGVKTQLRFGRLRVTGLVSSQRGKTEEIYLSGGAQRRNFEIQAHNYDENRHFFLGHFFRENYEKWLATPAFINSGVTVTRVEVYVTNLSDNTQGLRNIAGLLDLGEGITPKIFNPANPNIGPGIFDEADNQANLLFDNLKGDPGVRNVNTSASTLQNNFSLADGSEFQVIKSARKLESGRDFEFHPELGYISLNAPLQVDEAIAVAYEYTVNGKVFKVGELTEDYQNLPQDEVIIVRLLKPNSIKTNLPNWDLMMKNIYPLDAAQVQKKNFQLRIVYRDDKSGVDNPSLHEGEKLTDKPLVAEMNLDNYNPNGDPPGDGNFDFIDYGNEYTYKPVTVDARNGRVIFPVLEPFGSHLESKFISPQEDPLIAKYVFQELYTGTKKDAEQLFSDKNKFFLKGSFESSSGSEVILPGINIAEGSVRVIAGGVALAEGSDYTVDYSLGRVRILNGAVMSSSKEIIIQYERADPFSFRRRSLVGTRLDYEVDEDIQLGGTFMHYNERAFNNITRVPVGGEPVRNTMWGLDVNLSKESRALTKFIDKLPLISTKEPSSITFNAEFAHLIPGHPRFIDNGEEGASYIDDFEGVEVPIDLTRAPGRWKLSATPGQLPDAAFNDLKYSQHRAKLAWYNIDNLFYQSPSSTGRPENITEEDLKNHYIRAIPPQEIFPNRDVRSTGFNETTLDLAYFPKERGQYNYRTGNVDNSGLFTDPATNWGGVTRAITTNVDFDNTNVEYIEFWLMDPFLPGENGKVLDGIVNANNTDLNGELHFNLGSVSEDVLKDSRHAFENGLPADGNQAFTDPSIWGRVTTQQYLTDAFDADPTARENQDIGLDGLKDTDEATFFNAFVNALPPGAQAKAKQDASSDDFDYYLGDDKNAADQKVLERYKDFNGLEANSPANVDNQAFVPSSTNLPDNEDLNNDNTVSGLEEYYDYVMNLKPGMDVGDKYIVDKIIRDIDGEPVTWFQFRIPIRQPDAVVGGIDGFKTIRYIRTFLTNFNNPVVLRMAQFRLISATWRRLGEALPTDPNEVLNDEPPGLTFDLSAVNIEENGFASPGKIPYVLPPGVTRDIDNSTQATLRLNEQSVQVCVGDLPDKDGRGIFRNLNLDLLNYKRLKMFLHAETDDAGTKDGEVTAFLRFGTDFKSNYYEVEVPLKLTPQGSTDPAAIWPEDNEIDIALDDLYNVKIDRNSNQPDISKPFTQPVGNYNVTVVGNPDLNSALTAIIGVRNPENDGISKSVCIWANELRVAEFDEQGGVAARAVLNAKLADFMTLTAFGSVTTPGFGSIQRSVSQRSRELSSEYGATANVNLHKLIPKDIGLSLPMYVSYEQNRVKPQYDPLDKDILLDRTLQSITETVSADSAKEYKNKVIDKTVRRSINFTNVRKMKTKPGAKTHIYDPENLSLTYAYSDVRSQDAVTDAYEFKHHLGSVAYNYSPSIKALEPFRKSKGLKSPWLRLVKDFNLNLIPTSINIRADLERTFARTQFRNADLSTANVDPYFEKLFTFNRTFNLRWNLSRSLSFDYYALVNTIIDEPFGANTTQEKRDTVWNNLLNFGRKTNFTQNLTFVYGVPFSKLPLTDWISTDLKYGVNYTWLASSLGLLDENGLPVGNSLANNRDRSLNGRLDLVKLYNKNKFLREANNPKPRRKAASANKKEEDKSRDNKLLKGVVRALMSVRSLNLNYSVTEGTFLPGYLIEPGLLGLGPDAAFIFGGQDPNIRTDLSGNGDLTVSSALNAPFTQNRITNLQLTAQLEPTRNLRIQLDARKSVQGNYQEIFKVDANTQEYTRFNPLRSGKYGVSYITLATAFRSDDDFNESPVFSDFENNRQIIKSRLETANNNLGSYDLNSQDVLIPAFMAAYAGRDPQTVNLSPFPKIPLPNWRVDYSGLTLLKPFKDIFSSFTITHAYSSNYDVGSFTSSLVYDQFGLLALQRRAYDYPIASIINELGVFIPVFVASGVGISERFAPIGGIDFKTKTNLRFRFEYRKERNILLNLANAQVTETRNSDFVLGIGYTKAKLRLPFFRFKGQRVTLKNDTEFRLDMTIRDSRTVQRLIGEPDLVTGGTFNFQIRPTISYAVNKRLNALIYFEKNINDPRISTSFKTSSTLFGVQARFNIAD